MFPLKLIRRIGALKNNLQQSSILAKVVHTNKFISKKHAAFDHKLPFSQTLTSSWRFFSESPKLSWLIYFLITSAALSQTAHMEGKNNEPNWWMTGWKWLTLMELKFYEKLLIIDPMNANNWVKKGNVLVDLSSMNEALCAYDMALKIDSRNVDAWIRRTSMLGELGRTYEVLRACEQEIKIAPNNVYACFFKGVALGQLGRFEDALRAYDSALKIDSRYINAWINKIDIFGRLDRPEDALHACEKSKRMRKHISTRRSFE